MPIVGQGCLILLSVAAKPGPGATGCPSAGPGPVAVLVAANITAAVRLVALVLRGTPHGQAPPTVPSSGRGRHSCCATNVVTFGLLYWQLDGGGPDARHADDRAYPDFQFPQTLRRGAGTARLAAPVPRPPLRGVHQRGRVQPDRHHAPDPRVKGLMAIQSLISLSVLAVVLSRVINILPP